MVALTLIAAAACSRKDGAGTVVATDQTTTIGLGVEGERFVLMR